jgi:signal transduction histidine kinase
MEISRRAGTAETATSVLHNVANVLNSVNVSASSIGERLLQTGRADLKRVAALVEEHKDEIEKFISSDQRGKHLPRFLIELSRRMESEEDKILAEVNNLVASIAHIKDVVSIQQSYCGISGIEEEVRLADLLDDAIRINSASLDRHEIEVVRAYADVPPLVMAKQKLLQIVVNLISNAKYAVMESEGTGRQITVRLAPATDGGAVIVIEDNGVGIAPENLSRLFSHGFTTRKDGHGFGLHSAARLAGEMGARIEAASDGPARGATFTLRIPPKTAKVPSCPSATT